MELKKNVDSIIQITKSQKKKTTIRLLCWHPF
jgi:hypothetical protein